MGPGIRTWQFTEPLLKQNHHIQLICLKPKGLSIKVIPPKHPNLEYREITQDQFLELGKVKRLEKAFNPDCIVSAATTLSAYVAVQLNPQKPVWIDQYGDVMSEAQMKSNVDQTHSPVMDYWRYEKLALDMGDCFSAVSSRNRYSLLGQLGSRGRLNSETVGYEFVYEIPCGIGDRKFSPPRNVLAQYGVDRGDFVVLWSGGYNTWADLETLFKGLEHAMTQVPNLHFVSTGGGIPHHSEKGYDWFKARIEKSKFKERYHLLGWIPHHDLESIYQESHIAVNCDRFCYEAILGSRNRILNWLKAGLPIVSTNLTELTQTLQENGLIHSYAVGNPEALASCLVELYKKRHQIQDLAEERKSFVKKHYSFDVTTRPLQEWVKNPSKAPDHVFYSKESNKNMDREYLYTLEAKYIQGLEEKLLAQKSQNQGTGKLIKEIQRLSKLVKERDKKIEEAHKQMKQAGVEFDQKITAKNQEIGCLHGELAKLSEQIHSFQRQADLARFEKEKLEIRYQERARDIDALVEQVRGFNQEIIQRDRTIGSAYDQLHQTKQKLYEQQEKIKQLESEINRAKELVKVFKQEFIVSDDHV